MTRPRVLLVDDEASIRRYVASALEDLDIEMCSAASVAEALALLQATGPVQLIITDLMMPGASGIDLLRALDAAPALRGSARLAMLSAGLDAAVAAALPALGVRWQLNKPVSLSELLGCVHAALDAPAPRQGAPCIDGSMAQRSGAFALAPAQAEALQRNFGGDLPFFLSYHDSCIGELARDRQRGAAVLVERDAAALRRLAHNLKSMLASLGYGQHASLARRLEDAASASDWPAAAPLWEALVGALDGIAPLDPR